MSVAAAKTRQISAEAELMRLKEQSEVNSETMTQQESTISDLEDQVS